MTVRRQAVPPAAAPGIVPGRDPAMLSPDGGETGTVDAAASRPAGAGEEQW